MSTFFNAGKTWTHAMDDQILNLFNEGKKLEEISVAAGRTPVSVVGRLVHLGALEIRGDYNYYPRASDPWALWPSVKELQAKMEGKS
jgi:hypothetical protein